MATTTILMPGARGPIRQGGLPQVIESSIIPLLTGRALRFWPVGL
jgi:hypothetical protein